MSFVQRQPAPAVPGLSGAPHSERPEPVFEALIIPHRSLSRRGVLGLFMAIGSLSAVVSLRFLFLGAWPVIAFSGVEVALAALLLGMNVRHARAREFIQLSSAEITVVQTDPYGRQRRFSLPAAWLQITLETIENRGSRLLLRSHGRGREVGAFLHTPERQSLFESLRDALHTVRQPRFDNEQLRSE